MPKITINGKTVEVAEGKTVIEAYKQLDEDIAHYCWHPGLTIAGVCRLCVVEIEGNPRLQIACNTQVADGMVVNNNSEMVKDAVKWGLDFHLINHPLDCPICDQAGECGLQDQYMKFGQYDSEMAENKVKKRKVVDLGERVVLDTERCILCSRCVRFTEEVSKTNELGIFNRGDRSEIGTFEDKPLNNNYSINTVDICPVGALTSKDFRFKQRVWYLKEQETVCPGCSTGCNVNVFYNEEGLFRVKPVHNEDVNGYWMCDKGRDTYKYVNRQYRLMRANQGQSGEWKVSDAGAAVKDVGEKLRGLDPTKVALVLTGQYSNEEYKDLIQFFTKDLGSKNVFHWINNPDQMNEFDGILLRGDRNPNTKGLLQSLKDAGVSTDMSQLQASQMQMIVVAGPQDPEVFPDLKDKVQDFEKADSVVWFTADKLKALDDISTQCWQIPTKTYVEKAGSFTNFEGKTQEFSAVVPIVKGALSLSEAATLMAGQNIEVKSEGQNMKKMKENFFVHKPGSF